MVSLRIKNLNDEEKRANVCGISANQVRPDVMGIVLALPFEKSKNLPEKFTIKVHGQGFILLKAVWVGYVEKHTWIA